MRAHIILYAFVTPTDVERMKVALLRDHNILVEQCKRDTTVRCEEGGSQAICLLYDVAEPIRTNAHLLAALAVPVGRQIESITGIKTVIVRASSTCAPARPEPVLA